MKIGKKASGLGMALLGVGHTAIGGIAIGGANMTAVPAASMVLLGAAAACIGYWYFMWGLRYAGLVNKTNRWLKFSATPDHKKGKEAE